ncbi:MAG: type II toxin-antitoxin system HicA family toxin [Nitrospirae bacterium]|nr:type II toxin-antitoxin system HicA family toxin [Nitrospirota bacterium]
MPRIPGKEAVRVLPRAGFEVFDQEGSHVYLHKRVGDSFAGRVTIPLHGKKILKPKTLKSILQQAGLKVEDFIRFM